MVVDTVVQAESIAIRQLFTKKLNSTSKWVQSLKFPRKE